MVTHGVLSLYNVIDIYINVDNNKLDESMDNISQL